MYLQVFSPALFRKKYPARNTLRKVAEGLGDFTQLNTILESIRVALAWHWRTKFGFIRSGCRPIGRGCCVFGATSVALLMVHWQHTRLAQ